MIIIRFHESLEQKLRRTYQVPSHVRVEELHAYIAKKQAENIMQQVMNQSI